MKVDNANIPTPKFPWVTILYPYRKGDESLLVEGEGVPRVTVSSSEPRWRFAFSGSILSAKSLSILLDGDGRMVLLN